LAAAVSSARHRNLAISFGILLLLGTGIVMTSISTRRAERLARQQINFALALGREGSSQKSGHRQPLKAHKGIRPSGTLLAG
jgi:hypothetical protein